jgi:hypothetical protein
MDILTGKTAAETFSLGNAGTSPEIFYASNGNTDYLLIKNFDPLKDRIKLAGNSTIPRAGIGDGSIIYTDAGNYSQAVDGADLKIFASTGDLIAVIEGGAAMSIRPFTGSTPAGETYLISLQNEFFDKFIKPTFFEAAYLSLSTNTDIAPLIAAGTYTSAYDHYLKAGQFEARREDTFFQGTTGNDTMQGIGDESILIGVTYDAAIYSGGADIKATSFGTGQVDTFIGSAGENIILLGSATRLNAEAKTFYLGNGDADYGLIKGFDITKDVIQLAGNPTDFTFENKDGNSRISKGGDLVAIVEGVTNLVPRIQTFDRVRVAVDSAAFFTNLKPFFQEAEYLKQNPTVAADVGAGKKYATIFDEFIRVGQFRTTGTEFFSGTNAVPASGTTAAVSGNNSISALGKDTFLSGVAITEIDGAKKTVKTNGNGVGEVDSLTGSVGGVDRFLIGNGLNADNTPNVFYVGNGSSDYVNINSFEASRDSILLAGKFSDYEIVKDTTDTNGRRVLINYIDPKDPTKKDLVARVGSMLDAKGEVVAAELIQIPAASNIPNTFTLGAAINQRIIAAEGTPAEDTFTLGNAGGTALYAGEEFLRIKNFDPLKDRIQLAGNSAIPRAGIGDGSIIYTEAGNYTQTVDGADLKIFSSTGDLVALIEGGAAMSIRPFTGSTPAGVTHLVSLQNEFFDKFIKPTFFEAAYLALNTNTDIAPLIAAGTYTSAYDHYLKAGQFEARREDTFFQGTTGNDTMQGIGDESILIGVTYDAAIYSGGADIKATSFGTGQVDTFIGSAGENIIVLGAATRLNAEAKTFYIGNGDADYGLIKGFDITKDVIQLAGNPTDFTFENKDGNSRISKGGDLIAVVEGVTNLVPRIQTFDRVRVAVDSAAFFKDQVKPFFREGEYLAQNAAVANDIGVGKKYATIFDEFIRVGQFRTTGIEFFGGTNAAAATETTPLVTGNDRIAALGKNTIISGVGITAIDTVKQELKTSGTGLGETDILTGSVGGVDRFLVGNSTALNGAAQVFYVGKGDADFVTINSFEAARDSILLAGKPSDYEITKDTTDTNGRRLLITYIDPTDSTKKDLVAKVSSMIDAIGEVVPAELVVLPKSASNPNGFALGAPTNQSLADLSKQFNEKFYLRAYPDVAKLIQEGKYKSALDYYNQVGQNTAGKEGFFTGTNGNDVVSGFGIDQDLYGIDYEISDVAADGTYTFTPKSLGVGEQDTLLGRNDGKVEDGFFLSALTGKRDASGVNRPTAGTNSPLYVGQGNKDFANIKNFNIEADYVSLAGKPSDYLYQSDGNNFRIFTKSGDLLGVVEGQPQMKVRRFLADGTFRLANRATLEQGFNSSLYLAANPTLQSQINAGAYTSALDHYAKVGQNTGAKGFFTGSKATNAAQSQNQPGETVIGFGDNFSLAGVAYNGSGTPTTLGVDEQDILVGADGSVNEFILGSAITAANSTAQVFYIGKKDQDFATVQNFTLGEDTLTLAGKIEDYTLIADGPNLNIILTAGNDLVAKVEGVTELGVVAKQDAAGTFALGEKPQPPFAGPVGSEMQKGGFQDEILDFRSATGKMVKAAFVEVVSDATYNNTVGLYRIQDVNGTVQDAAGNSFKPGDAGYLKAALANAVAPDQGTRFGRTGPTADAQLAGGYMYSTFIVSNGSVDEAIAGRAQAYFNFVGANNDGFDHIKSLGANKFGFEDLAGGGDRDYNDLIFKVNATVI